MEESIDTVLGMFPHVSKKAIERDLNMTQNVEQTLNHIFDGTVVFS